MDDRGDRLILNGCYKYVCRVLRREIVFRRYSSGKCRYLLRVVDFRIVQEEQRSDGLVYHRKMIECMEPMKLRNKACFE